MTKSPHLFHSVDRKRNQLFAVTKTEFKMQQIKVTIDLVICWTNVCYLLHSDRSWSHYSLQMHKIRLNVTYVCM